MNQKVLGSQMKHSDWKAIGMSPGNERNRRFYHLIERPFSDKEFKILIDDQLNRMSRIKRYQQNLSYTAAKSFIFNTASV